MSGQAELRSEPAELHDVGQAVRALLADMGWELEHVVIHGSLGVILQIREAPAMTDGLRAGSAHE